MTSYNGEWLPMILITSCFTSRKGKWKVEYGSQVLQLRMVQGKTQHIDYNIIYCRSPLTPSSFLVQNNLIQHERAGMENVKMIVLIVPKGDDCACSNNITLISINVVNQSLSLVAARTIIVTVTRRRRLIIMVSPNFFHRDEIMDESSRKPILPWRLRCLRHLRLPGAKYHSGDSLIFLVVIMHSRFVIGIFYLHSLDDVFTFELEVDMIRC